MSLSDIQNIIMCIQALLIENVHYNIASWQHSYNVAWAWTKAGWDYTGIVAFLLLSFHLESPHSSSDKDKALRLSAYHNL